jgi:cytochrome subunit of sulfide dehydrogenase
LALSTPAEEALMMLRIPAALALCAAAFAAQAQTTAPLDAAQMRAAAYLSANCANCHGTAGRSKGAMPSLAGLPANYFITQMQAFKAGTRSATIMHQLAKGYTDEQIVLMAAYFAAQKNQ